MPKTLVPKTQSTRQSKQPRGSAPAPGLTAKGQQNSKMTSDAARKEKKKPKRPDQSPRKRPSRKRKSPSPETPPSKQIEERMSDTSNQILHFRKIWLNAMESLEEQIPGIPDVSNDDRDIAAQKLCQYVTMLQSLIAVNDGFPRTNVFDRCLGVQRWHIGHALLLLKPLPPEKGGLIKHGKWEPFLDAVGLDDTMAWRCRAVAYYYPRRQDAAALHWQWTTLVDALPSRKKSEPAEEDLEDDEAAPPHDSEGEDLIQPIGNYVKRLAEKAEHLLTATGVALKTVEAGRSVGLTFSSAREAAGFKGFVPEVEAVVCTIYKAVVNLYRLAEMASESELATIRDDLLGFLNRYGEHVKEDVE